LAQPNNISQTHSLQKKILINLDTLQLKLDETDLNENELNRIIELKKM